MPSRHFVVLDLYRFIAAFGVFLLHFTEFGRFDQSRGLGYAFFDFALFVDFFFILSGFVIGATYFDKVDSAPAIFTFLRRRIARIYPLHILTLAVYLLPAIIGISRNAEKGDLQQIFAQALLYQSWFPNAPLPLNFPAWSISVEWGMYLLFPLLALIGRRFTIWSLALIAVAGFVAIEFILSAHIVEPPEWFANISLFRALPTFTIGLIISRLYGRLTVPHGTLIGAGLFCAAVGLMMAHASPYAVVAVLSATVLCSASGTDRPRIVNGRAASALGDASYGLYMIHSITLTVAVQYFWFRMFTAPPPIWFGLVVGAITTAIAMLLFRMFEKPAKDFISGRPVTKVTVPARG